ncbi:Glutamate receptor 2.7 [Linum perenne]
MNYQLFIIKAAAVFLFICSGAGGATTGGGGRNGSTVRIGVIVDVDSRIGREEKTAIEIALKNFNEKSTRRHNFSVYYANYTQSDPLKAAYAAEEIIKTHKAEAIIGLQSWDESALVGEIGSRYRVPVLSLAPSTISRPLKQLRWPSLMNIAGNNGATDEIQCIAALVRLYEWRKVTVIYEDDAYGGNSGKLDLLSESLTKIGSEIEHRLILPPYSSLLSSGSKKLVRDDVISLFRQQSRVFIVLQASLPMAIELFKEAKSVGLSGRDSAWIVADDLASLLDSVDETVISSMEGTLGIKRYFSDQGSPYRSFKSEFRNRFRSEFPEEDNLVPGIHALRAYDGIRAIADAVEREEVNKTLTEKLLSSNFTGLSGELCFSNCRNPMLRVVNVLGKKYRELDFWRPELGIFTNTAVANASAMIKNKTNDEESNLKLEGVTWPGNMMNREPKGWKMPTETKPMIIGVPGRTSFEKFVKVVNESENKKRYDGFCIDLFDMVLGALEYDLPYNFEAYNGTYEELIDLVYNKTYDAELIDLVYNKTYDAIIGDITILASRSKKVEFTQPFTESGLSMIVPTNSKRSAWMFLKPFTAKMWLVTGVILIYTMLVIWFFEHQTNPDFNGPLRNQMGTALHFTFSSLFFAHREKVYSNLTRVVLVVWLFVVLILNSSYTANLSSMLTVLRLQPNSNDIDWLKKKNLKIGWDGNPFVKDYLQNVLNFKVENIKKVDSEYKYEREFDANNISAAFLEIPYQKEFINHYCRRFTAMAQPFNRFGGFGFVFQKGSPIAADVSMAILKLSEDGELQRLEDHWFATPRECLDIESDHATESLSLQNFWGLYVVTGATSTICLMVFLVQLLKCKLSQEEGREDLTVWNKIIKLAKYIYNGKDYEERGSLSTAPGVEEWSSPRSSWECESPHPQVPDDPRIPAPAAV